MLRRMDRARYLGALAVVLAVLLAACFDDETTEPGATPSSTETTPSPGETDPTEPTEPTVEPATGRAMAGDSAFARAPEGFRVSEFGFGILNAEKGRTRLTFADFGAVAVTTPRQLARTGLTNFKGRPTVTYDADVGGAPAYLAVGTNGSGPYVEYGAVHGGNAVLLAFAFPGRMAKDEQDALIASVLASFSWSV